MNLISALHDSALAAHSSFGWHVDCELKSSELKSIRPLLFTLPSACVNLTEFSKRDLPELFRLAAQGIRLKTCGLRTKTIKQDEWAQILIELHATNPNGLMYGSNTAPHPDVQTEMQLIQTIFCEDAAKRLLHKNAEHFYQATH